MNPPQAVVSDLYLTDEDVDIGLSSANYIHNIQRIYI